MVSEINNYGVCACATCVCVCVLPGSSAGLSKTGGADPQGSLVSTPQRQHFCGGACALTHAIVVARGQEEGREWRRHQHNMLSAPRPEGHSSNLKPSLCLCLFYACMPCRLHCGPVAQQRWRDGRARRHVRVGVRGAACVLAHWSVVVVVVAVGGGTPLSLFLAHAPMSLAQPPQPTQHPNTQHPDTPTGMCRRQGSGPRTRATLATRSSGTSAARCTRTRWAGRSTWTSAAQPTASTSTR